jgi:hypothetical protein
VFNFTAPTPTNNIILVPNPNGGAPLPVVQHKHQANNTKPPPKQNPTANKPPATVPAAAPAQPAAPESALGSLIHHIFGGGASQPTPQQKPVMHNGKAYYKHADGNYYLTP